jgi:RNA methyltransferase, TrmH family
MLTKAQNKYIRSLSLQKYRKQYNVFIAEGVKICEEWLQSSAKIQMIVAVEEWIETNSALISQHPEATLHLAKEHELENISALQTANQVLLVVNGAAPPELVLTGKWYIALDKIRDPGNMGTIIRIADWFGMTDIICSEHCTDAFSPKVIQGAMGSHLRVNIHIRLLAEVFQKNSGVPVYAATLNGENIYSLKNASPGIILIGNESKGISDELIASASHRITIPRKGGAESLNAGVSAGIICALLAGQ